MHGRENILVSLKRCSGSYCGSRAAPPPWPNDKQPCGADAGTPAAWRGQGKHADARDLLAPVYAWFTEGFATPDLKEAKAMLDTLR